LSDSNNNLHLTLFGYESDVIERIIKLKDLGATDIMLAKHHYMENEYLIHKMVEKMVKENI